MQVVAVSSAYVENTFATKKAALILDCRLFSFCVTCAPVQNSGGWVSCCTSSNLYWASGRNHKHPCCDDQHLLQRRHTSSDSLKQHHLYPERSSHCTPGVDLCNGPLTAVSCHHPRILRSTGNTPLGKHAAPRNGQKRVNYQCPHPMTGI
jgi:hypothetical protein